VQARQDYQTPLTSGPGHNSAALDGALRRRSVATIPADKKLDQRQIEATDQQTDALVYELNGLTEEEIAIVEARDH
jgi:hypothetical protein